MRRILVFLMVLAGMSLSAAASPAQILDSSTGAPNKKPATIKVIVPANAQIAFDSYKTEQTGEVRLFESPPLPGGQKFKYTVKASWKAAGKDVVQQRELLVQAGVETSVDFRPDDAQKDKAEKPERTPDVIYWPTPQEVVDKMLELAEVKKDDVVYDLGCGDARIPVTAAKRYKVKAYGFDIDPERVWLVTAADSTAASAALATLADDRVKKSVVRVTSVQKTSPPSPAQGDFARRRP